MVELDEDIESFEYEASYGGTASIDEGFKPSEMEADVAVSALSQVEADCELVNYHVPGISAAPFAVSPTSSFVWLSISFRRLQLGSEQAVALGLYPEYPYLAVRLTFGRLYEHYTHSMSEPIVSPDDIIQTKDPSKLGEGLGLAPYHCRCVLAGLIADRLGTFLSGRLKAAATAPTIPGIQSKNRYISWVDILFGLNRHRSESRVDWGRKSAARACGAAGKKRKHKGKAKASGKGAKKSGHSRTKTASSAAGSHSGTRRHDMDRDCGGFDGDLQLNLSGCMHSDLLWPVTRAHAPPPAEAGPLSLADALASQIESGESTCGFSYAAMPRWVAADIDGAMAAYLQEHGDAGLAAVSAVEESSPSAAAAGMSSKGSSADDTAPYGYASMPHPEAVAKLARAQDGRSSESKYARHGADPTLVSSPSLAAVPGSSAGARYSASASKRVLGVGSGAALAAAPGLADEPPLMSRAVSASSERSTGPIVHPVLLRTQMEPYLSTFNPLVSIYLFVEAVVQNAHRCCLSCGIPLRMSGMKPSICGRSLCMHRYTELGLGMALDGMVLQQPQVVDLLISLFYSFLAESYRKELRWDAAMFAQILSHDKVGYKPPVGPSTSAATGGASSCEGLTHAAVLASIEKDKRRLAELKSIDVQDAAARLRRALDACPSLGHLQVLAKKHGLDGLVAKLNELDPLIVPILRMLVVDTPAHIRGLTLGGDSLPGCSKGWVFVFKAGELSREAVFQDMRKKRGSFFAFHGSHAANWHVILKTGLKNMSGSKYMSAGAAFGPGIYFANSSSRASGYAREGSTWPRSMLAIDPETYKSLPHAATQGGPKTDKRSRRLARKFEEEAKSSPDSAAVSVMALCELIPEGKAGTDYSYGGILSEDGERSRTDGAGIHVLKEESKVVTRYLIVSPGGTPGHSIDLQPTEEYYSSVLHDLTKRMVAKVQA